MELFLVYEEMDVFLQYLKGLFSRVQIRCMHTYSQSRTDDHHASKIIDMCANFLEGRNLEMLSIGAAKIENL